MVRKSVKVAVSMATLLLVATLSGCIGDEGNGDSVEWKAPASVEIARFDFNKQTNYWDLVVNLLDDAGGPTAWDGELRVILFDSNLTEAYNGTESIKEVDYELVHGGSGDKEVVAANLLVSIQANQVGTDPGTGQNPEVEWDAQVAFSFGGEVLRSERRWTPPTAISVKEAGHNINVHGLAITCILLAENDEPTKWAGSVNVELTGPKGKRMYDDAKPAIAAKYVVKAAPGKAEDFNATMEAEVTIAIPYSEINRSDVNETAEDKEMTINVTFIYHDEALGRDVVTPAAGSFQLETPPWLLCSVYVPPDNDPPVASATAKSWWWRTMPTEFNASGSNDPDGEVHNYTWDFKDGSTPVETTNATVLHAFQTTGVFEVLLTVADNQGACDSITVTIDIRPVLKVTVKGAGVVQEPGDYLDHTFVVLNITNMAPFNVSRPSYLSLEMMDDEGRMIDATGINGTIPVKFEVDQSIEVTIYFAYIPTGGTVPVPFDPARLTLWDGKVVEF
jgi:PKD repeat protein